MNPRILQISLLVGSNESARSILDKTVILK